MQQMIKVDHKTASERIYELKNFWELKEHQIEALKLTAERQNYPVHKFYSDIIFVLSSGLFDKETVIHDFTCGQPISLMNTSYHIAISRKLNGIKLNPLSFL
jgi:hypothetical protein